MPKFMDVAPGGINNLVQFIAGVQRGKERRRKEDQQEKMKKLITGLGQQGGMDVTMKMSADGEVSYSLKPGKAPKAPTEEQRLKGVGRFAYGMPGAPTPSAETMLPVMPPVVPYAGRGPEGGGYVGGTPAEGTEFAGAVPLPPGEFPEVARAGLRRQFEERGFEPTYPGMRKIKEEKKISLESQTEKSALRKKLSGEYFEIIAPKFTPRDVQKYIDQYGKENVGAAILRKFGKTREDYIKWIEEKYGLDYAKELYPEFYVKGTKGAGARVLESMNRP